MLFEIGLAASIVGGYGLSLAILEIISNFIEKRKR